MLNQDKIAQLISGYEKLPDKRKEEWRKKVTEELAQIDAGTFNVTKNVDNPIRFWAEEYRVFLNSLL